MEDGTVVRIGAQSVGQSAAVFELVLSDYISFTNPNDYGLVGYEGIDPNTYYVTSGDAVEKAKVLEKDVWRLAGSLRRLIFERISIEHNCDNAHAQELFRNGIRPKDPPKLADYEVAIWKAAGQCRKLLNALKDAKGSHIFLECEWSDHSLLCVPKDPRTARA